MAAAMRLLLEVNGFTSTNGTSLPTSRVRELVIVPEVEHA
jgi:hypothetical protein